MTLLNAILGNNASAILVLASVGVVLLAAAAATLDFLSGTSRVLSPSAFSHQRALVFTWLGLPAALVLLVACSLLGALASGMAQTGTGTRLLLVVANAAFVVAVFACGTTSPLGRHWGLGLAVFAAGLGAIFPLLALISALGFDESGLLTAASDRAVFGIAVGGIVLSVALCGCAVVSMLCYIAERIVVLLRSRRHLYTSGFPGAP